MAGFGECGILQGPAGVIAYEGLNTIQDYAADAIDEVDEISGVLQAFVNDLVPIDTDIYLEQAGTLSDPFLIDPLGYFDGPAFAWQSIDYDPELGDPTFNRTVDPPPDFTKPAPGLDFGERPDDLTAEAPTNVPQVGDYEFPADPTDEIPPIPALVPIVIPDIPDLTLPTFTGTDPGDLSEDAIGAFSWAEDAYVGTVQTEVVTQLQAILGGSTGIPDAIWDMIEMRARRQMRATARQAREEAADYWASRGHFLSNGQLRLRTKEAADVEREGVSDIVRELVIQDARIYVERLNNALAQGIALEGQLIGLHNGIAERSLKATELVFTIAIQVANLKIAQYNSKAGVYLTKAQVFNTLMQGEIARLEVTKTEIEAQKLVGQLNLQTIEAYKAQVQGIEAVYELFKSQIAAVVAKYDADKTRVMAFGEQVKAYLGQVQAKETEWRGYGESVKAEISKLEGYKIESDAFLNRVNAYRIGVDVDKITFDAAVEKEQLKAEWLRTKLTELSTNVEQASKVIDSELQTDTTNARIYEANARVEESRVRSDVNRLEILVRNANYRMQIQVQETQMRIQEAQNILKVQTDALNAVLQAQAQVGSSALAALNYGARISDDVSNSATCNSNYAL